MNATPVDDLFLREARSWRGAVDVFAEVRLQPEQHRFALHLRFGGPAENDQLHAPRAQDVEHRERAGDHELLRARFAPCQPADAALQRLVKSAQIYLQQGGGSRRADVPFAREVVEAVHLVDRRLAVQRKNVATHLLSRCGVTAQRLRQEFCEHLDHHVRPAVAQPRKRAVEIEDHMREIRAAEIVGDPLDWARG